MEVDDLIREGGAALASGRWAEARSAFESALARGVSGEALDGLGEAMWWLGQPRRSNELREQAYARFRRAGDLRRALLAALGVAVTYESSFGNTPAANGWIARAMRLLRGDEDPLAPWVWTIRAYVTPDHAVSLALNGQALEAARAAGDVDLELCALSGLGQRRVASGEVASGLQLIDEAMAGTLGGECSRMDTVVFTSCDMLVACELANDLSRAARWCEVADSFIRKYGCPFLSTRCRTIYGGLLVARGRWAEAERELLTAIQMSDGAGPAVAADAHARLADLRLRQGRIEAATRLLRGHEDQTRAQVAAAALRLAQGDPTGAVTVLQRHLTRGGQTPAGAAPALALLVQASIARGDVRAAGESAARLTSLARQGSGHTQALAAASTAQVSAALEKTDEACAHWETALRLYADLDMPYEVAGARLELARSWAAHRPDVAAGEADTALEAFERIGASIDADAAAALLRALGVAPRAGRRGGDLTGRERQVLDLVSAGLSNPEIAARLHISRKTAAHHVSSVLAKLGVRNRVEAVTRRSAVTTSIELAGPDRRLSRKVL